MTKCVRKYSKDVAQLYGIGQTPAFMIVLRPLTSLCVKESDFDPDAPCQRDERLALVETTSALTVPMRAVLAVSFWLNMHCRSGAHSHSILSS